MFGNTGPFSYSPRLVHLFFAFGVLEHYLYSLWHFKYVLTPFRDKTPLCCGNHAGFIPPQGFLPGGPPSEERVQTRWLQGCSTAEKHIQTQWEIHLQYAPTWTTISSSNIPFFDDDKSCQTSFFQTISSPSVQRKEYSEALNKHPDNFHVRVEVNECEVCTSVETSSNT